MTPLIALILGVLEGFTEFLPISSTGHLILASSLLGIGKDEFVKSFEIAIQLGAILSVVILYGRTLIVSKEIFLRVITAFVPTAIIGFLLHGIAKKYFLDDPILVLWTLLIGGIILIAFEKWHTEKPSDVSDLAQITFTQAMIVGLCQSIAIVPGVSRAAATVIGGMLFGIKRQTIVEFSFLLAIPTMAAATALDLLKSASSFTSADFSLLSIGFVTSFIVALFAIKWLLKYIKNHTFTGFGVYRVLVGVIGLLFWR